jgi:hypothetical protein
MSMPLLFCIFHNLFCTLVYVCVAVQMHVRVCVCVCTLQEHLLLEDDELVNAIYMSHVSCRELAADRLHDCALVTRIGGQELTMG